MDTGTKVLNQLKIFMTCNKEIITNVSISCKKYALAFKWNVNESFPPFPFTCFYTGVYPFARFANMRSALEITFVFPTLHVHSSPGFLNIFHIFTSSSINVLSCLVFLRSVFLEHDKCIRSKKNTSPIHT